jgi:hypothetical protein
MRPSFRHVAPDRIQIRQGGGCLAIFGLPFFGAGVFMLLASLGVVSMSNERDAPGRLALSFMGLVFTAVGGVLCFGRAWTLVDGTRREAIKQWGLMVPMHSDTQRIDDYTAVVVEFVRGDSDTADKFPVSLKAKAGKNLQLCSSTEYGDSRSCAAAVAELLRFDFEDATTDHPVRLSAGQAAMPLQQRLQLDGTEIGSSERPAGGRSGVHRDQGSVRITIPTPRTHPVWIVLSLIPIVFVTMFVSPLSRFFRQSHTPDPVGWIFLGFLILFFGVLPAMTVVNGLLRARRGGTIVTASTSGISIQERGAWKAGPVKSMTASEILDIDFSTSGSVVSSVRHTAEGQEIGPRTERVLTALSQLVKGGGITIKTQQGLTTFGLGLGDDEIRYLHSILRRALTGL